jgi:hypothetical protein
LKYDLIYTCSLLSLTELICLRFVKDEMVCFPASNGKSARNWSLFRKAVAKDLNNCRVVIELAELR